MKTFTRSILGSLFLIIAAPAFSALSPGAHAVQIFVCEFNDDATSEQVLEMSASWLKAARKTKGGEFLFSAFLFLFSCIRRVTFNLS